MLPLHVTWQWRLLWPPQLSESTCLSAGEAAEQTVLATTFWWEDEDSKAVRGTRQRLEGSGVYANQFEAALQFSVPGCS